MAIYYVDPVNGNDSNNGNSFATAVKTPNSASLAAVTGGDEVRFAESTVVDTGFDSTWTLMQGAQAGGINITAATNASPIQITSSAAHGMSTGDWVFISGVLGNTYANGMWRITKVDNTNFTLIGSAGNAAYTSGGAMRRRNGSVIPLPSGSVKSISMCGNNGQTVYPYNCGNWTAANANVTCALNTTNAHQGNVNQSITLLAAFTGGKVAYQALGSAQDFSAYQAISFSLMTTTLASLPNNQFYIALCSDTTGNSVVDIFYIPDTTSSFGTGLLGNSIYAMKYHIAKSGGGNLGSSIQSVALYTVGDPSNPVLQLDNIVAVKALSDTKCISVQHLVSNGIVADGYWGLGAVWNDSEIGPVGTFDTAGVTIGTAASPYWAGTNGVARLYTILPYNVGSIGFTSTDIYTIPFNSVTTPIIISGGWSVASSMSTKTGRTAYATRNGGGRLFALSSKNGFQWSSFIIGYCAIGINMSGNYGTSFTDMHFYGCNSNGISQTNTLQLRNGVDFFDVAGTCTFTTCGTGMTQTSCFGSINKNLNVLGNSNIGMTLTTNTSSLFDNCKFQGTAQNQVVSVTSGLNKFTNCQFNYGNYGLQCSSNGAGNLIKNCSFNNNATAGCYFTNVIGSTVQGCTFGANTQNILAASGAQGPTAIGCNLGGNVATPFYLSGVSNMNLINCQNASSLASSWAPASTVVNYQNCSNNGSTIYFTGSTELYNAVLKTTSGSATETRSPDGGTSTGGMKITLGNVGAAGSRTANNKSLSPFGIVNCTSGKLHTVKGWIRNVTGGGTDFGQIVLLGGSISGVATDVASTPTSSNSWLQHEISFTPTENATVQIYFACWGGVNFYFDGFSVTIAP
jgi:hypothetical protein